MKKSNIGDSKPGNFKMPGAMREAEKVPGHGDGNPSYKGHGNTSLQTYKSNQKAGAKPPFSGGQTPGSAVGHGSSTSYPKKRLPSFGTDKHGVLTTPPGGMQPKAR